MDTFRMDTMRDLFDRFETDCIPDFSPGTQRQYRYHLKVLRQHFADLPIGSIKPRDIIRFLDVPTSKQMRNKHVSVLSSVFTKAIGRWGAEIDINPCLKVERHPSPPRDRYITDDEFVSVWAIAPFNVQNMMTLAYFTGQRQGDLLDLRWEDVLGTHIIVTPQKTYRRVPKTLGIRMTAALDALLIRARNRSGSGEYVIQTVFGKPYTKGGFRSLWQWTIEKALRQKVIQRRFTFHDIRAKCATDKKDLKAAQALLNHSSDTLTKRIYQRSIIMVDSLDPDKMEQ